jgi:hypothetical protein
VREKSFRRNRIRSLANYYRTLEFYDIDCRAQPEDSHLAKLLDNPTVFTLALPGTSVIGFRVSLLSTSAHSGSSWIATRCRSAKILGMRSRRREFAPSSDEAYVNRFEDGPQ